MENNIIVLVISEYINNWIKDYAKENKIKIDGVQFCEAKILQQLIGFAKNNMVNLYNIENAKYNNINRNIINNFIYTLKYNKANFPNEIILKIYKVFNDNNFIDIIPENELITGRLCLYLDILARKAIKNISLDNINKTIINLVKNKHIDKNRQSPVLFSEENKNIKTELKNPDVIINLIKNIQVYELLNNTIDYYYNISYYIIDKYRNNDYKSKSIKQHANYILRIYLSNYILNYAKRNNVKVLLKLYNYIEKHVFNFTNIYDTRIGNIIYEQINYDAIKRFVNEKLLDKNFPDNELNSFIDIINKTNNTVFDDSDLKNNISYDDLITGKLCLYLDILSREGIKNISSDNINEIMDNILTDEYMENYYDLELKNYPDKQSCLTYFRNKIIKMIMKNIKTNNIPKEIIYGYYNISSL